MTEHDLRTEEDRWWETQAEHEQRATQLDLARIKRWDNAFWAVALPGGAAVVILAGFLWGA